MVQIFEEDVMGFEYYLHFNDLVEWHLLCDNGNYIDITCEDKTGYFIWFHYATS